MRSLGTDKYLKCVNEKGSFRVMRVGEGEEMDCGKAAIATLDRVNRPSGPASLNNCGPNLLFYKCRESLEVM